MRLIDADQIIKDNENEIQRLSKKIERLESGEADIEPYYADQKIKQYQRDITDYKIENRILKRYETAYDVDKIIERLEAIKENGACDGENCGHCKYFKTCWEGEMSDRLALDKAIKIVKGGGIDG